ncbi:hypothetical protein E4T56_gene14839 [Termitomyces sp. T112]|nr:hypothetical protein E4T56_gene14839 [Termitomyces sp. T112]
MSSAMPSLHSPSPTPPPSGDNRVAISVEYEHSTNASPASPEPLEPSPAIPDFIICHQPITLVPPTHYEVS